MQAHLQCYRVPVTARLDREINHTITIMISLLKSSDPYKAKAMTSIMAVYKEYQKELYIGIFLSKTKPYRCTNREYTRETWESIHLDKEHR